MGCHTQFWFGRRKHHCRSCGKLFCSECSEKYLPIPAEQLYHPVRVCDVCFQELGEVCNKLSYWSRNVNLVSDWSRPILAYKLLKMFFRLQDVDEGGGDGGGGDVVREGRTICDTGVEKAVVDEVEDPTEAVEEEENSNCDNNAN